MRTLEGLLGDSDRPGYRRLYFSSNLRFYGEFRSEDVIVYADIPADQSPFLGEQATRVTLVRDAPLDMTRSRQALPIDEFDLDIRFTGLATSAELDLGPEFIFESEQVNCENHLTQSCQPTCPPCEPPPERLPAPLE